ncbi:alpha-D-xyloside xylohydrolase [Bryocella elongata]|uniref:Alpha-D-xyloside xylohydrolase n=1 Tax=Bryocella elongata TaxID=863522 RepID=A0A1H5WSH4_9BACT|nr:TIM-barrel domain-containing protein [Bryocella elongata]SEG02126.1 alpha-D-xyloside xylohydrolase [Bryocella elongata]
MSVSMSTDDLTTTAARFVEFVHQGTHVRVGFVQPSVVRITCTQREAWLEKPSRIVAAREWCWCELTESGDAYLLTTSAMRLFIDRESGAMRFELADGTPLMYEPAGARSLIEKPVYRNVYESDAEVAFAQSVDGTRAIATPKEQRLDRMAYEATLSLQFAEDEAIYGLGSHEEGHGNLRGCTRDLYQQNMKAVVPMLVSTRGYGILMDCGSLMLFRDAPRGAEWWCDVVDELDYYVLGGGSFDGVTRAYFDLTGPAPMLPKWSLGYVQSKERYVTGAEMLEVVREYRRRSIPLDCIVLDWKSWPNGGAWGQKSLDPLRFPDPEGLSRDLHQLGVRWMASIWPIMTGGCENQRELLQLGGMLGNQSTYDAFHSDARGSYWRQVQRGLFDRGVDAWWCDCTEPFEADWAGVQKPEPIERMRINTEAAKLYLDAGELNTYSLEHSRGIYEGQRSATNAKRVLNLTRSSYAGQHRYGTVTWNGDICARWDVLRACIAEGCHFTAAGEPYWTVDIGGFFVGANPELWFWKGDYNAGCRGLTSMDALQPDANDTGCTDLGYWELYTRWLQYAAFLPMFRSHGTDAPREIWRFGEQGSPFYDTIARFIRLRYELMPYLYSLMAAVTRDGSMMMRCLGLEFPHDVRAHAVDDQFLLGHELLVCPVTKPMYFDVASVPIEGVERSREVYLPAGADWYDFWTEQHITGGQRLPASAPLELLPVYVRSGSILVTTEAMQFVDERPEAPWEIRVYIGADARFTLYEDAGDGYGYEQGESSAVDLLWLERERRLNIGARLGSFPGMVAERTIEVVFIGARTRRKRRFTYRGEEVRVELEEECA